MKEEKDLFLIEMRKSLEKLEQWRREPEKVDVITKAIAKLIITDTRMTAYWAYNCPEVVGLTAAEKQEAFRALDQLVDLECFFNRLRCYDEIEDLTEIN